ncbi:MAG TPA: molybdenum cofactor guanylyltransferase [Acidimicrobiales bacterium]|nr:molybdenum cofactor guanylyltransferase [Acidimicrobiales bacterium]
MFGGAVLTGGDSRRMGRDKAFVTVDGVPMVQRVATTLATAGARSVMAVGGDVAPLTALGLDARPDPRQGNGPLGGLVTAMELAVDPVLVVVATDLAWLPSDVVIALVERLSGDPAADVAAANGGRREPMCAAWRIDECRDELAAAYLAGERAVHVAMERLSVADVAVASEHLRNANYPEDLRQ